MKHVIGNKKQYKKKEYHYLIGDYTSIVRYDPVANCCYESSYPKYKYVHSLLGTETYLRTSPAYAPSDRHGYNLDTIRTILALSDDW